MHLAFADGLAKFQLKNFQLFCTKKHFNYSDYPESANKAFKKFDSLTGRFRVSRPTGLQGPRSTKLDRQLPVIINGYSSMNITESHALLRLECSTGKRQPSWWTDGSDLDGEYSLPSVRSFKVSYLLKTNFIKKPLSFYGLPFSRL